MDPIEFVERKEPDWDRVQSWLSRSREVNRWANGGPVARALEEAVTELLGLPEDRAVVATASATAAMFALAGAHSHRAGRPLRWVVSAFGFFTTAIGPLDEAIIVDCDRAGLLDQQALAALDPAGYDGVIVTNPFGLHPDWRNFAAFCRDSGKILLYDNAHALLGCDRRLPQAPDEVVSFHHTKPWGMGEGGCAIVSRQLEGVVRSLINFGVGLDERARPFASNGKLSDLAAAFALDRLEDLASWSRLYRRQEARIVALAAELGLRPLAPSNPHPRSSAALVADLPVDLSGLSGKRFTACKYYRPLADGAATARWLFDRIVNVPCHPGMAALADDQIVPALEEMVGRAARLAS